MRLHCIHCGSTLYLRRDAMRCRATAIDGRATNRQMPVCDILPDARTQMTLPGRDTMLAQRSGRHFTLH